MLLSDFPKYITNLNQLLVEQKVLFLSKILYRQNLGSIGLLLCNQVLLKFT